MRNAIILAGLLAAGAVYAEGNAQKGQEPAKAPVASTQTQAPMSSTTETKEVVAKAGGKKVHKKKGDKKSENGASIYRSNHKRG